MFSSNRPAKCHLLNENLWNLWYLDQYSGVVVYILSPSLSINTTKSGDFLLLRWNRAKDAEGWPVGLMSSVLAQEWGYLTLACNLTFSDCILVVIKQPPTNLTPLSWAKSPIIPLSCCGMQLQAMTKSTRAMADYVSRYRRLIKYMDGEMFTRE